LEFLDQLVEARAALALANTALLQGQAEVVPHAQLAEDAGFLGQITDAQPGPLGHGQGLDLQAVEQHRYAGRPIAPGVFAGAMEAARRLLAAALPALLVAGLVSGLIGAAQAALSGHGLVVELP
jgi:hypothetical protein